MPTPQREPLRAITPAEQAALQRIVSASSERVDQVRRATAVLAVAQGDGSSNLMRRGWLACAAGRPSLTWSTRFNLHGLAALDIAAGRGRKPT
jgi:hypothetical protein